MATFSGYNPYMASKYGVKPSSYGVLASDGLRSPGESYGVLKTDAVNNPNTGFSKGQKAMAVKAGLEGFGQYGTSMQNASISAMDAASLDFQGAQASARARKESGQVIGSQVVGTAANGLQMSGSSLDALEASQREAEYDAYLKKSAYSVAARASKIKAMQEKTQGMSGLIAGFAGAAQSLSTPKAT